MYRLESSDVAMGCPCNSSVSLVKFSSQAVLFLYPNEFGIRTLYAFDLLTHEVHPLLDSNESQDLVVGGWDHDAIVERSTRQLDEFIAHDAMGEIPHTLSPQLFREVQLSKVLRLIGI